MTRVLAGRYELEVPLGRGGSGEVWRGRDMATRRPVAVKLVELAEIDDPGLVAETIGRFRREAVVVAGLRHPNIVAALDAGRAGNELFLVMELAQGVSLASMLDQRAARGMGLFPVASVLRIAGQAGAGLAAAHAAGVVHRDIKPSNLMVAARLDTKIIDFGISRLLADNSPRLTMPSHMVGTPAYVSPEQARGGNVDGRADLYSLGCVLYELLAGRPPFLAERPEALLMMQVMDQAVPLSVIRPNLPAGLSGLVSDLMEKDPDARPADAAQVLSRIAAISAPLDASAPVHEADRQTVRADDRPTVADVPGPTAADVPGPTVADVPGQAAVRPEAGRSTVLTSDRLGGPGDSETPTGPIWIGPVAAPPPGAALQAPPPAWGQNGATPEWPAAPERPAAPRRRRRWRPALSTLLTIAIVAGIGIYVWHQKHERLQVTSASVAVANPPAGCDTTVNIFGTVYTNGRGGPVSYQWIRDSQKNAPVLVADAASGSQTLRVELKWTFHGKGTDQAVAEFRVLKPEPAVASTTFTYSCP
jgi:serine/threonine-protein kinase